MKAIKLSIVLATLLTSTTTFACVHFQVESNNSYINARSMEFGVDTATWQSMPAEFVIYKKGMSIKNLSQKSKFGYAGIETYNGILTEGVNEKGLSMAALWFTEGKYPEKKNQEIDISNADVIPWALSQFSSAEEIIENLKKMNIYAPSYESFHGSLPLHYSITDRDGSNYVVEFIGGEIKIFNNRENKVLTNDPSLDKQLDNLALFYKDNPAANSIKTAGELNSLPGGYGSQQRFIKVSVLKNLLPKTNDPLTMINQSISLLNNIDYPRGVPAYEADANSNRGSDKQETSWISVIDLNEMKYYYRTSTNYNMKFVDLKKTGFKKNIKFNIYNNSHRFIDITPN
jgi:penicillin V acylase-like amidase (Ntn superfamily)